MNLLDVFNARKAEIDRRLNIKATPPVPRTVIIPSDEDKRAPLYSIYLRSLPIEKNDFVLGSLTSKEVGEWMPRLRKKMAKMNRNKNSYLYYEAVLQGSKAEKDLFWNPPLNLKKEDL